MSAPAGVCICSALVPDYCGDDLLLAVGVGAFVCRETVRRLRFPALRFTGAVECSAPYYFCAVGLLLLAMGFSRVFWLASLEYRHAERY